MTRHLILTLALMFMALGAPPSFAASRTAPVHQASGQRGAPVPAGKVELRMMVVYATTAHSQVDPRLTRLTRYLSHLRFSGYELLSNHTATLGTKGRQSFNIAGGRKVNVTLLSRDDRRARMRVVVLTGKGGKLLDTTLSVNRNGTFIVAGPKYKDGVLVLPLTARY